MFQCWCIGCDRYFMTEDAKSSVCMECLKIGPVVPPSEEDDEY